MQLCRKVQQNSEFLCCSSLLTSAWPGYCRKNPLVPEVPSQITLKSATVSHRSLCRRLLTIQHTQNTKNTKLPIRKIRVIPNDVQECLHICLAVGSFEDGNVWPVSRQKAVDATPPPLGRLAIKQYYWPVLRCLSVSAGSRWSGNNVHRVSSVTSPSSSAVLSTLLNKLRITSLLYRSHQWR